MAFTRMVADYSELLHALRDRAVEMQISRCEIDEISGLASGYAGKLLSLSPAKIFGPISMGPTLEVLGLRVVLVEDTGLTKATESRRTPVDQSNQRFGNRSNSKPSLLPPPDQVVTPPAQTKSVLTIVRPKTGVTKYG